MWQISLRPRKLTDVVDISNQSSKEGIRIVLELKKDADVNRIKAILYKKKTKLEDTYGVNMLAIDEGRPETMNLKQILNTFLDFQYRNMTKKYNVLLQKEMEKKEVQEGYQGVRCDRPHYCRSPGIKEHEGREGMPDDRKYGEDQVPCAGL